MEKKFDLSKDFRFSHIDREPTVQEREEALRYDVFRNDFAWDLVDWIKQVDPDENDALSGYAEESDVAQYFDDKMKSYEGIRELIRYIGQHEVSDDELRATGEQMAAILEELLPKE